MLVSSVFLSVECVCIYQCNMGLTLPAVVIRYSARTSAAVPKTVVGLESISPLVKSADLTHACAFNERMLVALNAHACVKFIFWSLVFSFNRDNVAVQATVHLTAVRTPHPI